MEKKRAICPSCGREVGVTKGNTIAKHGAGSWGGEMRCNGSGVYVAGVVKYIPSDPAVGTNVVVFERKTEVPA